MAHDYLAALHQLVGHPQLLMFTAATLILDEHNRMLLMKRVDRLPGAVVRKDRFYRYSIVLKKPTA